MITLRRFPPSLLLLAGLVPVATPAGAQPGTAVELQAWIARQPEYAADITGLYSTLRGALELAPSGMTIPATLRAVRDDPEQFYPALQEIMTRTGVLAPDGAAVLTNALDLYRDIFTAGESCEPPALPLPESLEAAATQIEEITADVLALTLSMLARAEFRSLGQSHNRAMATIHISPYGGFPPESRSFVAGYLDLMANADLSKLDCAARHWSRFLDPQWLDNLRRLMADHAQADQEIIARFPTPYGLIHFGGSASHALLNGNILFSADLGGDDIYALRTADAFSGLPQLIIDFSGNDVYESQETGGYASGIGAVSLLADLKGDDTYHATSLTQGAGLLGAGMLFDAAGNDEYLAKTMAQGFSLFGIGLLVDSDGDDIYQAAGIAQGLGMAEGLGFLVDEGGNDRYLSTGVMPTNYGTPGLSDSWSQGVGLGLRQLAPGGVGVLQDRAGTDRYTAGSMAQGGGYFYGLGLFNDDGFDSDTYLGARYNFGWSAHVGMGYFREAGGNDHYRTRQFVAAGLAWDMGMAVFQDDAGDDTYDVGAFSLGAGAYRSLTFFLDNGGNDTYNNSAPAMDTREGPNLSLFIDSGSDPAGNYFSNGDITSPCVIREGLAVIIAMPVVPDPDQLQCESP